MSDLTKEYLDEKLNSQTKEIKSFVESEVADLAGIVSRRFDELEKKLDLREEIDQLKIQMSKVWSALNIKS